MNEARRATAADAVELVRLRGVLMTQLAGHRSADGSWKESAEAMLRERLAEPDPTLVAFVVDRPDLVDRAGQPDRAGLLAACAVGTVEYRLPGPGNPSGEVGYVFNVVTDPAHRRRGYSRSCMAALLDWYRDRGIRTIDLRASSEGEPLYRSLGFALSRDPAMRLRLQPPE
ncbi:GNAT family N-acetyltransferase [Nonomuraea aurantiaca]|jgi:GNAT superfamily N-acetyltransferase|uniref:GNAT family N-acetyltransferase n=1 Tax=Nonomuraea aurantiaca TaxID=2878562 RepID=UPI001CD9D342|nr:GNAT family N-acetyltransferase [Nonomuraea aurantiaca]MCA2225963.1 GNAT family N-acetyltransferase [Nonomuraea aurantiaca]